MQVAETITGSSVVDDVVTRFPATARVFVNRRMHCVGCEVSRFETLAGAALIYQQPIEPLLADLRAAADQRPEPPLLALAQRHAAQSDLQPIVTSQGLTSGGPQ